MSKQRLLYGLTFAFLVPIVTMVVRPVLTGVESTVHSQSSQWDIDDDPSIAQAVVAGVTLPEQNIRYVTAVPQSFTLSILYGGATFFGGGTTRVVTMTSPGWLIQPAIIPGPLDDESHVVITSSNGALVEPAADTRLVLSVDVAHIASAYAWIPTTDPSYLVSSENYYVNDLRLITDTRSVILTGSDTNTMAIKSSTTINNGWRSPTGFRGIVGPYELCIRLLIGPGKVFWDFTDKTPREAKYSVKPENSDPLVWGSAPQQNVDGIYRTQWGCCKAFKIPDSCDFHYTSSGGDWWACCNIAADKLAKKKLKWVDPCNNDKPEKGWVDCPLCE